MASSSTASEGADEVATEIPEDLVLSWTRDATTIRTFGTLVENAQQLLEDVIQCVHKGKDANATKQQLSLSLSTGKARKPVAIRARVLTRLIAIALGLHPDDITIDSETGKESLRSSVEYQTALRPRLVEALQHDNTFLSYLFKDALEADDEVMTVIFCDPRIFKKYPVPFFHGCDLDVVQEISKLWLSKEFLKKYYDTVLEPLFNQVEGEVRRMPSLYNDRPSKTSEENLLKVKEDVRPPKISEENLQDEGEISHVVEFRPFISEENLLKATMMLCELLRRRTVKAGARLLEVILSFYNARTDLVRGLVIPLVGLKNGRFWKCFVGDLAREVRWPSRGSDQVRGRHGESITVGPSSAQTDSNLLWWAARRGYSHLIWCTFIEYTPLEDATEALAVSLLWKVAFWCATRHGQDSVVVELARPPWVKSSLGEEHRLQ